MKSMNQPPPNYAGMNTRMTSPQQGMKMTPSAPSPSRYRGMNRIPQMQGKMTPSAPSPMQPRQVGGQQQMIQALRGRMMR